ncbi:threonine synthase [Peptostreptococcaceae bacterium AGR-M142]
MYEGLIKRYKKYLDVDEKYIVSLNEGNTPLIRAKNLEKILDGIEIYLKYDGLNPTGSFKDRGMTMAVSKALEENKKAIICASTGNTSAAAAAYGARAKLKVIVIVPDEKIAKGKLAQAIAYGAKIIAIKGNFDDALESVKKISKESDIQMVNSLNKYRIEGQKTAAFELIDDLKELDYFMLPVGNAGNITAYHKGFKEYLEDNKLKTLPRLFGFQAKGASPIVENKVFKDPKTIATAINIGNPASWDKALNAIDESNGQIDAITDEDILKAYNLLAKEEGVFAEPASCISVAGLIKSYNEGKIKKNSKVVCLLTGNGLKDIDVCMNNMDFDIKNLDDDYLLIKKEILSEL